jgi:hypothetical protein
MLNWADFTKAAPEIAEAGLALTDPNEVALLATVSAEGRPRLHPQAINSRRFLDPE